MEWGRILPLCMCILFVLLPTMTLAQSYPYTINDTGQDACFDNTQEITCPAQGQPFYGQDAQLDGIQPAFQNNGDGTITDLNTGLMWIQACGSKVTWSTAMADASSCTVGGHSDWRMPTIKELYSLIDFRGTDPSGYPGSDTSWLIPYIDTDYFEFEYGDPSAGERIIDAQYWSSNQYLGTVFGGDTAIFGFNFADGRIKGYPRDLGPGGSPMTEFVRYVRGNTDYGANNFTNNGDGTITDSATGLMWSQNDNGTGLNWESALAYIETQNGADYLGYNDWRLPNAKELQSIVDYTRCPDVTGSPAIDPVFNCTAITNEGGQADYPYYWIGTTHISCSNPGVCMGEYAAYVCFGRGLGYMFGSWIDVHGAGCQRSDPKSGDPNDWPYGHGPQGDAIRIYNYIRCVRGPSAPVPTEINDLGIMRSGDDVILSWTYSGNATFNVYSDTDPFGNFSTYETSTSDTSVTLTGAVISSDKLFYIVRASN